MFYATSKQISIEFTNTAAQQLADDSQIKQKQISDTLSSACSCDLEASSSSEIVLI